MKKSTPLADVEGVLAAETDGQSGLLPALEMIDRELVELALESHARALMYPDSKVQHDRANECRDELLKRLTHASDASKRAPCSTCHFMGTVDICDRCGKDFGLSGDDGNGAFNSRCVHCGNNTYTAQPCPDCPVSEAMEGRPYED